MATPNTRDDLERRMDADDVKRETDRLFDAGQAAGRATCAPRGPLTATPGRRPCSSDAADSGGAARVALRDAVVDGKPDPQRPPFVVNKKDAIEMLVDPVVETVWMLVGRDSRASADLLLEISEALIEHSEHDRKEAIRRAKAQR